MTFWVFILIVLALMPLVLLSIPLAFRAGGVLRPEDQRLGGDFSWGFGLLAASVEFINGKTSFGVRFAGFKLPVPGLKKKAKKREENEKKDKAKKSEVKEKSGKMRKTKGGKWRHKMPGFSFSAAFRVLNRRLMGAVLEYMNMLFKSLRLRLNLSGIYGTDDPALTGMLAGMLAAMPFAYQSLSLEADFSGPALDVSGEISGRIVPIVLLWLTIRLLLAAPVRKLWWAWLKNKMLKIKAKESV